MALAERFFIVGAGGHAQVVLAAWQAGCCSDYDFHCFLGQRDVDTADTLQGHPIRWQSPEALDDLKKAGVEHFILGVGKVKVSPERFALHEFFVQQGFKPLTLVHPTAYVPEQVELAEGVFVGARAVIQPFAVIGPASIVNTGAIIEHHCVLGANVHAAPGSILCGQVSVGDHSLIGAGATVIQSCRLGTGVSIGAGAVVTRDVEDAQKLSLTRPVPADASV